MRRTKTDTSKGIRTLNSAPRIAPALPQKSACAIKSGKVANYGSYGAMNK
jgi:hypothetical protein